MVQKKTTYDWGYAYTGPQPHAPSSVGQQAFTYDASGRQVIADARTQHRVMTWDSEDRIRVIQEGGRGTAIVGAGGAIAGAEGQGKTTEFLYDDQGQRIVKSGAQGHTAYVNPHYTLRNETIATKHVFVGSSRVASKLVPGRAHHELPTDTDDVAFWLGRWWQHRSESGWEHGQNVDKNPHYRVATQVPSPMGLPESNFIYFYHPDHLGSTSFVTDGEGEIYEHVQYFPHGEIWADERSNTERLPYLFTGKELDQETGLYDFGARQYDPRVGVWLSPDPALGDYLQGRDGMGPAGTEESTGRPGGAYDPVHLSLYTYANHRPTFFTDPDGRWAGLWHRVFTRIGARRAIRGRGYSRGERRRFVHMVVRGNVWVDNGRWDGNPGTEGTATDAKNQHQHAMLNEDSTPEQSRTEANAYVKGRLAAAHAVGQQQGNPASDDAAWNAGNAVHTVQDDTQRAHGFDTPWEEKPAWGGGRRLKRFFQDVAPHAIRDTFDLRGSKNAIDRTQHLLEGHLDDRPPPRQQFDE